MPLDLVLRPLTLADAAELRTWRYPAPYDLHDGNPAADPAALLGSGSRYLAADDPAGSLAGFVCIGPDGRVPGGIEAGLYREPAVDLGLGLRPDRTGRGLGLAFVRTALRQIARDHPGMPVRLNVAAFNQRARTVYERAGFARGAECVSPVRGELVAFLVMHRPPPELGPGPPPNGGAVAREI